MPFGHSPTLFFRKMETPSIQKLRRLAEASKAQRFLHHPARYLAFLWKSKLLPRAGIRKSSLVEATTFWGGKMKVSLPSSSDIFLTGGKTHDSEIRLAQWLMANISRYTAFIDVGAHIGFFSLLAAHFSGNKIAIRSFEPSRASFALLSGNTKAQENILATQMAVGGEDGEATFHEFSHAYAEFSSLVMDNYDQKLRETLQKEKQDYTVPVRTLERILPAPFSGKTLIKIDTEGNELAVLQGAKALLQSAVCDFVIEFLDNGNETYRRAETLLRENGFKAFLIKKGGSLEAHADILGQMNAMGVDSENVVFLKEAG